MRKTYLLEILAKKDEVAFLAFLETMDVIRVTEDEEAKFVSDAPPKWLEAYFTKTYPSPRSERYMMADLKYEKVLKTCERLWGFNQETVCVSDVKHHNFKIFIK